MNNRATKFLNSDSERSKTRAVLPAVLWLAALCAYVIAGIPTASFHGDEAMLIHTSRDYATAFLDRAPERLLTTPPYPIDSDGHLRILNGTVLRYTIGLSWHLAGFSVDDLPPPPGWDWGLSYDTGVATGHRPPDALLYAARLPSALFLCVSIVALFGIAQVVGGPLVAYIASGLYALHPTVLLNGRRAMQEGPMLGFGLLTVLLAALISRRRGNGERVPAVYWALLALMGSLTLASKHSGAIFVAVALGWLVAAELVGRRRWRSLIAPLAASAVLIVVGFIALSPGLWSDPPARLRDLVAVRQELLNIQIVADPLAPTTLTQRTADMLTQPFLAPAMHYEVAGWGESPAFAAEVERSQSSPLSGIPYGWALGLPLTSFMLGGVVISLRRRREPAYAGLVIWLLAVAALLLANPLPWQRYALPLIPAAAVFAGVGIRALAGRLRTRTVTPAAPVP